MSRAERTGGDRHAAAPAAAGHWPGHRSRRTGAVLTALSALIGTSLVAGPAAVAATADSCALERTDVHHSEGLDTWNPDYPRPRGELDALMIFLAFPENRPAVTPGRLAADYFPETSRFFERASYGTFTLRPHAVPRWFEMAADSRAYGIQRDWSPELRSAYLDDAVTAADPHVDFADYDVVYLVADPDAPGVNSDATKVVNLEEPISVDGTELHRVVTVFERHPPDRNVLAHETLHVFDLPDLYHQPEEDDGDWDTHVGDWDLMGSQFGLSPEPLGWHKWKLGWLDDRGIDCRVDAGTTRHVLRAIAAPTHDGLLPGSDDTRMVVVRTGRSEVLAIEAREPVGNDITSCTDGVLVYRVRGDVASAQGPVKVMDGHPDSEACARISVYPELADAPLGAGESLEVDAGTSTVRVTVGERTTAGWTVEVTVRGTPGSLPDTGPGTGADGRV
ncbi:M6 family metalloprotease domain-containing protein [Streptomyces sp. TRM43335]|uniref:M6 family metalloprotease domain-containing protein n=1 Tax=Streptomyces taklimakanensis TaxID=2569853 RepID=A0A6G2BAD3_9ACTN|nr:M6 family metalloprotease domain-containing protein [Streptomyces taklimakanensis]MTE19184.1 M6 family metalloprotease domain-containing protein [Streptomyces taklimakanensis]